MSVENRYEVGAFDERPWGKWEVLAIGERYTVKRITVKPKEKLSLQLHHGRDEHWTIAHGVATVTVGEKILNLKENDHVFIPVETVHRVENPGENPLVFIEVQYGEKLDENDIVRLEDTYGRI